MINTIKYILAAAISLISFAANASCGDTYYNNDRRQPIANIISSAPAHSTFWIGDSFIERASTTYGQGLNTLNGYPVYMLGSAGATVETLINCIPWSSLNEPHTVIIQIGLNDAVNNSCCSTDYNGTPFWNNLQILIPLITASKASVVLVSDPPPEAAAGINIQRPWTVARIMKYVSDNTLGNLGPLQFIDLYSLMSTGSCSSAYQPFTTPCYSASHSRLDYIHPEYNGIVNMFTNLTNIP
jgi:lysophospholipase L1-like esterase